MVAKVKPTMKKASPMTATRQFYLNVNPIVFHSSQSADKTIESHEMNKGVYFYMSKSYRLQSSKTTALSIAGTMAAHIMKLIQKEAMRLIKFWHDNINMYFNRRAHGRPGATRPFKPTSQQLGRVKTNYIANSRQHTGQLRRSLIISKVNMFGAELYAKRVHAKTNNRDYIDILMSGAPPGPRAYIPAFDLRGKKGIWKGIPREYWMIWQYRFMKEIVNAERRLNNDIEKYVEKMNILSTKQIRASRSNRINKEFVKNIDIDIKNFNKEMGKSKYDHNQGGEDPIDAPFPYEETWQGMKEKYYGQAIPANNLSWTTELNDVIKAEAKRKRRTAARRG